MVSGTERRAVSDAEGVQGDFGGEGVMRWGPKQSKVHNYEIVSLLISIRRLLIAILVFTIFLWMESCSTESHLASIHKGLKDIRQKIVLEGKENLCSQKPLVE